MTDVLHQAPATTTHPSHFTRDILDEPVTFRSRLDPRVKKAAILGLICCGTLISTLGKLAYEIQAVGRDGAVRPFHKPLLLVLLMFIGMSLNLPLSLFLDLVRRHRRTKGIPRRTPMYVSLLQYDNDDEQMYGGPLLLDPATAASNGLSLRRRLIHKQLLLLLVPTLFDALGSVLLNVGLLAVTASAAAMLRQSLLLFAALLGVGLFGKQLNKFHGAGLAGCLAGLMMVAAASLASGFGGSTAPHSRGVMAGGIGLVLASQLAAAGLMLFDHAWPSGRLQLSPLKMVGCEGLLGAALMLLVVLPLADVSSSSPGSGSGLPVGEDCWDSLVMIASRPLLQLLLLVYTASLQAYNLCGMVTAGELSAVDTTLLQAVRTLFVWISNLLIYAVGSALLPDSLPAAGQAGAAGEQAAGSFPSVARQQHRQHQQPASLPGAAAGAGPPVWQVLLQAGASSALQHASSALAAAHAGSPVLAAAAASPDAAAGGSVIGPVGDAFQELPGEPWLRWSFLQAGGFVVLVLAAVAYSWGDSEGRTRLLQAEAALIMLDQPPGSAAGSLASGAIPASNRHFTAGMDIDTAAFLHSFSRGNRDREPLLGVTPVSHSFNFGGGSSSGRGWLLQESGGGSISPTGESLLGDAGGLDDAGAVAAVGAAPAGKLGSPEADAAGAGRYSLQA